MAAQKIKPLPSQERLRQRLEYDPDAGLLFWRGSDGKRLRQAFTYKHHSGAFYGGFDGLKYSAHRIIWKIVHGCDPYHIDHIDGNASNNRLNNLRSVNPTANHRNRRRSAANTSGINGVYKRKHKWRASITMNNKTVVLGHFATIEEAAACRRGAEKVLGYSLRHGVASKHPSGVAS